MATSRSDRFSASTLAYWWTMIKQSVVAFNKDSKEKVQDESLTCLDKKSDNDRDDSLCP
jgi:hypothetical protein